ncbi:hypothetical protein evm_002600 [Chilo suppressalis]|nr:hypothetical protein evm_002600 [Chilo suppressalis]
MKMRNRLCTLVFGEMQLKAPPNNDKEKKSTFSTNTDIKTNVVDHVLIFMLQGLTGNYKQPLSYSFSEGPTNYVELANYIKNVIQELHTAGFKVLATLCNMNSNNQQAIQILREETSSRCSSECFFVINDDEIVPLYDPSHLLKDLRNNLLTKNLQYEIGQESGVAKWSHMQLLYDENPGYANNSLIPKLTENHVVPMKINKTEVKYASQVFSRSLAVLMGYLAEQGVLPAECTETANLFLFLDSLYDSVNGSRNKDYKHKPLLGPVTPRSVHRKTWRESLIALESMHFINNRKIESTTPTIQGWIATLKGVQKLTTKLQTDHRITSFWMQYLNQDELERFFEAIIRQINQECYTYSLVQQFQMAFREALVRGSISVNSSSSNSDDDGSTIFSKYMVDIQEFGVTSES